ncbi:MAG: cytochrome P450 [Chloroflexi bacterium]|nr:cytochrome P450 [Chloroflexota bacterium]
MPEVSGPSRVERLPRVTGYESVRAAGRDFERYSSLHQGDEDVRAYRQLPLEADPPLHSALRAFLVPFFSKGSLAPFQQGIKADARELVAPLKAGELEMVRGVGLPLVVRTIAQLLDRPSDIEEWASWGPSVWGDHDGRRDGAALLAFLERAVDEGAAGTGGRLFNLLARTPIAGVVLTRDQQIGVGSLLLAGGRDTVMNLISGIAWMVAAHPTHVAALRGDLAMRTAFIEETLRLTTPLGLMERIDRGVSGGDPEQSPHVGLDFASANHDATVFTCPAELRLDRPATSPHIAFGIGPHACVGAPLARIEAHAVLNELLAVAPSGWAAQEHSAQFRSVDGVQVPASFQRLVIAPR